MNVRLEQTGSLGRIRLDRPKALNSLTYDMVRAISAALDRFETDPDIAAILISGEGERGLCAGGDVRAVAEAGRAGERLPLLFWREEYRLNARVAACPKPYIALMDGITMGGGVGISAHGSHRIVTDRTRLAMPETGIGFFPDIGGTWLLSHVPGELGTYLGLTGAEIGAPDAIAAGLADTLIEAASLATLVDRLAGLPPAADVTAAIAAFGQPPGPSPLAAHRDEIDRAFAHDDVASIIAALDRSGSPFARRTLQTLSSRSPTSLKLTLRLLRLARTSPDLATCLEREYAACHRILDRPDFFEGVRAAIIDKDRNPRWSPASLDEVSDDEIEAYLSPAPEPVF